MTRFATQDREPQEGLRRHKLITQEIANRLPALYATDGQGMDAVAQLKLFCPLSGWTLFVTEWDCDDTLYGCCVNGDVSEWGYSSFQDLATAQARRFGNMPAIERDRGFTPATVRECVEKGL